MRKLSAPYEYKRTSNLLKIKEFVDSEFKLLNVYEGVGNAAGGAKVAVLQLKANSSETFKADITGTREELLAYLKSAPIGKMQTIQYQNLTPAGVPRFPKLKICEQATKAFK